MPITHRRFPYPYKALLAICSDIDSMHPWQFMTVHKFLNTLTRAIPHYGEGVGLDIGDRFYFKNMSNKGVSVYDACYRCRGEEDAWVDELGGKNARSMEPANAPLDDLRGITFDGTDSAKAEIRLHGTRIPEREIQRNRPDQTGAQCVSIRWFQPDYTDYAGS